MSTTLTPEALSWQQELPDGLLLHKELVGSMAWEAVDERYGVERPVERVVRFYSVDAEWRAAVLTRLQRLAGARLSSVETPLEAGWIAGGSVLYLVERPYQSTLETRLSVEGLPVDDAQAIFSDVVDGIAELHALRLSHGDLRPENILLRNNGTVPEVCIGNVVTGPLPFWSGGRVVIDELQRYLPPEVNGAVTEPSEAADLYALGVLGCELFLGHRALPALVGKTAEMRELLKQRRVSRSTRQTLLKLLDPLPRKRPQRASDVSELLRSGIPVWLERSLFTAVIVLLFVIAVPLGWGNNRLEGELAATQTEVKTLQQKIGTLQNSAELLEQQTRSAESRNGSLEQQLEEFRTQLSTTRQNVDAIRAAITDKALTREQLASRILQIIGQPVPDDQRLWSEFQQTLSARQNAEPETLERWISSRKPAIDAADAEQLRTWCLQIAAVSQSKTVSRLLDEYHQQPWSDTTQHRQAQTIWEQWYGNSLKADDRIAALRKARSTLPQDHPVDRWLTGWQRQLPQLGTAAGVWLTARTNDEVAADIRNRVQTTLGAPWDQPAWESTVTFCRAAGRAAALWNQLASQSDLSWEQFGSRWVKAMVAEPEALRPDVEQILKRWEAEFEKRSGSVWKLQLVKAAVTPPEGETEVPDYGKDRIFNLYSGNEQTDVKHAWSSSTAHSYAKSKQEFVEFQWKVGEPIELLLEVDGWAVNDNLVDQAFSGPVNVWRLHTARRVGNPGTGVSIDVRVVDCPGPPKEVIDGGVKSALDRSVQATTATPEEN
ncbi:MAG: hypothetical protein HQ518_10205 [Rhodopirellula sp.]|nr:hypothetical protein [Rhodopirellula sp.]